MAYVKKKDGLGLLSFIRKISDDGTANRQDKIQREVDGWKFPHPGDLTPENAESALIELRRWWRRLRHVEGVVITCNYV